MPIAAAPMLRRRIDAALNANVGDVLAARRAAQNDEHELDEW